MDIPHFLKKVLTVCLLLILFTPADAQSDDDTPIVVDPQRNYTGNIQATDRIWFYKNADGTSKPAGNGVYPSTEISDDGNPANDISKAVYVRGNNITVEVKLKDHFSTPGTIVGSLTLSHAKFVIGSTEHSISVSGPSTVSIPGNGGSQTITLTFSGLPNYVAKGHLKFRAFVTLTQPVSIYPTGYVAWGDPIGYHTWDTIYLVDQQPTGLQTVPWTDLLEFSCGWAQGQTGDVLCTKKVTLGLYWSGCFAYNIGSENITSQYVLFPSAVFKLTQLITDWISSGPTNANCQDVSFSVMLASQSLGINASCKRIYEIDNKGFLTNPMCPIGSDATELTNYKSVAFSFHQQTYVQTNVFDGALALRYDLTGATYKNPPCNWDVFGYWQTWGVSGHPVLGLTYRLYKTTDTPLPIWGYTPDPLFGPAVVNNYGQVATLNGIN